MSETAFPDGLHFGALMPSLMDQLEHLITTEDQREEIEHLDRDAAAVTRLKIRGLIPESVANRARDRIAKSAEKAFQSANEV